jgi:hypothetical protein
MASFVTLESQATKGLVATFDGGADLQTKGSTEFSDETKKGTA